VAHRRNIPIYASDHTIHYNGSLHKSPYGCYAFVSLLALCESVIEDTVFYE